MVYGFVRVVDYIFFKKLKIRWFCLVGGYGVGLVVFGVFCMIFV